MTQHVDTVVVGGGAMGSSTAWNLARRGRPVVLLERFAPGHKNGASHGATRNFSTGYVDEVHNSMIHESRRLWNELEDATGETLLDVIGTVNHGGIDVTRNDWLREHGVPVEMLAAEEAHERWPGIRFATAVQYMPEGARVRADAAVAALQQQTAALGGVVKHNTEVLKITVLSDDAVEIVTGDETYIAKTVVVTVGAWTTKLLGATMALPQLVVTQEQPAHFQQRDIATPWPSFNHAPIAGDSDYDYWYSPIYGMLTPGEGIKAGWHGVGPVTDPDLRSFVPESVQLAALQRYARDWLPGTDPDDFIAISCTYTTSPNSVFVLDRVGPIVVGAGFSGHGFKFTPSVGRILADLVDGTSPSAPVFSLAR
ncbi:FAD-dependent oxidoreductase [Salinibacterium sp. NG253]|uniref:FAD-dependent oxidoreductase n=1 Tax=Salinibacterium sp. NG253 TaxID=2792039 RepID=UPI0018CF9781|nr:FAD-dependent oxidoreductase [Salinibacterium sp. NG253]MBH0117648.1 FAD-dependent oxidoreductase [Salinibacterium sp. NG253]